MIWSYSTVAYESLPGSILAVNIAALLLVFLCYLLLVSGVAMVPTMTLSTLHLGLLLFPMISGSACAVWWAYQTFTASTWLEDCSKAAVDVCASLVGPVAHLCSLVLWYAATYSTASAAPVPALCAFLAFSTSSVRWLVNAAAQRCDTRRSWSTWVMFLLCLPGGQAVTPGTHDAFLIMLALRAIFFFHWAAVSQHCACSQAVLVGAHMLQFINAHFPRRACKQLRSCL